MAWGRNDYGQLGQGTISNYLSGIACPVPVSVLSGVAAVTAGESFESHSIALKNDGTVWGWGYNGLGQIGQGTFAYSIATPVQVPGLSGIVAIAGGGYHTLALKNDGTVWAWGNNSNGQLGQGTFTTTAPYGFASPAQVPGLSGVVAIAGGGYHTLVLKGDGTVWAWGNDDEGELGQGMFGSTIASPIQVPGLSGIIAVEAGRFHTLALKNDGTVWVWGDNRAGQLGQGSFTYGIASPIQVPGLSGTIAVEAGRFHTLALKNDGTVWVWGDNSAGQLGQGTFTTTAPYGIASPVQVPGLSGVLNIAAGDSHTLVLKSDGTVWAWGNNQSGQIGQGYFTTAATPGIANPVQVQVGGLSTAITIDGHVLVRTTSPSQYPITGAYVTVSQQGLSIVGSATTDSSGHYSISLCTPPGNYTVKANIPALTTSLPSLPSIINYHYPNGYQPQTQNPASDLTQLTVGQNTGINIYVPKPLVLVHGWNSAGSVWSSFKSIFESDPAVQWQQYPTTPQQIARRAYWCKTVDYDSNFADFATNASDMGLAIGQFRSDISQHFPVSVPIDVIAHSMGGLVTRAYLHLFVQSGDVDRVWTLGTPHIGVTPLLGASGIGCSPATVGVFQMDPLFLLNCFQPTYYQTHGARFVLVGSSLNMGPEPELILPVLWQWSDDDGLVSTLSSVDYPAGLLPNVIAVRFLPQCHGIGLPFCGQNGLNSDTQVMTGTLLPDLENL